MSKLKRMTPAEMESALKAALQQIKVLEAELAIALEKREGIRSDGTVDKYTNMEASELRELIAKRGGNPNSVVAGFHSRQRSIKMREWLRANPVTKNKTVEKRRVRRSM